MQKRLRSFWSRFEPSFSTIWNEKAPPIKFLTRRIRLRQNEIAEKYVSTSVDSLCRTTTWVKATLSKRTKMIIITDIDDTILCNVDQWPPLAALWQHDERIWISLQICAFYPCSYPLQILTADMTCGYLFLQDTSRFLAYKYWYITKHFTVHQHSPAEKPLELPSVLLSRIVELKH